MSSPASRLAVFCLAAILAAASARAFSPEDFDREYEWRGTDFLTDKPFAVPVDIVRDDDRGNGLVPLTLIVGSFTIQATFSVAGQTVSVAAGQYLGYDPAARMDVYFYHGRWSSGVNTMLQSDAVFTADGASLALPADETIVIGNESRGLLMCGRENVLAPLSGLSSPAAEPKATSRYFTLDGVRLPAEPCRKGLYLRVCGPDRRLVSVK